VKNLISRRGILIALLSLLFCVMAADPGLAKHHDHNDKDSMLHANASDPGSAIEVKNFLATDKPTLIYVRSMVCPNCKRTTPRIIKLSNANQDIRIVDVVLDRATDAEIGFKSAAAKQFDVRATPTYVIYDKDGKVSASGDAADTQVDAWFKAAGV